MTATERLSDHPADADPTPDDVTRALHAPYDLDPADRRRFDQDGFVRLRGALDPACVAYYEPFLSAEVDRLYSPHAEAAPDASTEAYRRAFRQIMNLWRVHPKARELVFGRRLAGIAAELLGVSGVRLYHDQALYKEADGGPTPWHADQYYWPLDQDRTVTAWIPLHDVPLEMGPLAFSAGSHRVELGRDLPISEESEATIRQALEAEGLDRSCEPFALGDVSFHLGWTFHGADANRTARPRRAMTIIFFADGLRVIEPRHDNHRFDLAAWLPGARPGELAATELNPVLFPG